MRLLGVTKRGGKRRMATVIRSTIDPAHMFLTDGRERKQRGTTKGIVVDSGRCYRAMRPDETCSPIAVMRWGTEISRQCAATVVMPWAGCAYGQVRGCQAEGQAVGVGRGEREVRGSLIMRQSHNETTCDVRSQSTPSPLPDA
jgi:hypothetical protein